MAEPRCHRRKRPANYRNIFVGEVVGILTVIRREGTRTANESISRSRGHRYRHSAQSVNRTKDTLTEGGAVLGCQKFGIDVLKQGRCVDNFLSQI